MIRRFAAMIRNLAPGSERPAPAPAAPEPAAPPIRAAEAISAAQVDAERLIGRLKTRLSDTSEDSPATRNEIYAEMRFLDDFMDALSMAADNGGPVDITKCVVDYGYDYEAASMDEMCGIEYVPEAERLQADYESDLRSVSPILETLRQAGVTVVTGFSTVAPSAMRDHVLAEVDDAEEPPTP